MSIKDYYDQYLIKEGDGICLHEDCNNPTEFKDLASGYREYCCRKCLVTSSSRRERTKQTSLKKYGVESATQLDSTKQKMKTTMIANYGVDHPMRSKEIKDQMKANMLETYGVSHQMHREDVKDKVSHTNMERYGVECIFANENIKEKIKTSNQESFGTNYPLQNKAIQEKAHATNRERYGFSFAQQNEEIKQKAKDTVLARYGTTGTIGNPDVYRKFLATRRANYWVIFATKMNLKNLTPSFTELEYADQKVTTFNFVCNLCKKTITTSETNPIRINCTCQRFKSKFEVEIADWLASIGVTDIIRNTKIGNRESDIIIPSLNIGIDFHGLYWHCDLQKDRMYHQKKLEHFTNTGMEFIQVLENEWVNKRPLIENIIKRRLGIRSRVVFARKCVVKELDKKSHDLFVESNHIQGTAQTSIRLGLFYGDELVSAMSFSKSRYSKKHDWELIRFVNKIDTSVTGGAAKLFNAFKEKNNGSIVSYCDLRLFTGKMYSGLGFTKSHRSEPDYFYFKKNSTELEHRSKYQKHKLQKLLTSFDPDKSEYENMLDNGFLRIFDAGNDVYEIKGPDQS